MDKCLKLVVLDKLSCSESNLYIQNSLWNNRFRPSKLIWSGKRTGETALKIILEWKWAQLNQVLPKFNIVCFIYFFSMGLDLLFITSLFLALNSITIKVY